MPIQKLLLWMTLLSFLIFDCVVPSQTASTPPLSGQWEGMISVRGNWRYLEADFGQDASSSSVAIDLPQQRHQLSDFKLSFPEIQFRLKRDNSLLEFKGEIGARVIRGEVTQDGATGHFQLVPVVSFPANVAADNYTGTYELQGGGLVSVCDFTFGDGDRHFALMDAETGFWGLLFPTSQHTFLFGSARMGQFPLDLRVSFSRDTTGRPGLALTTEGHPPRLARRTQGYSEEAVSFNNGPVKLSGTLVKPKEGGPFPAVAMLHSSGHQSRNGPAGYFRLLANLIASRGTAVLIYDKRGVGESTGSWFTASLDDLAGDAVKAIEFLRARDDIDEKKIGLWALSQGGWLAPMAAAKCKSASFLVLVGSPAVSPAQQEIDRVNALLRKNGFSAEQMAQANRYLAQYFDYARTDRGWPELLRAAGEARNEPWGNYVHCPTAPEQLTWWRQTKNLEPARILAELTCPILTIHGELDPDIGVEESVTIFRKTAKNRASEQVVYPGADHYILVAPHGPQARDHARLASGYLSKMLGWVHRRAITE